MAKQILNGSVIGGTSDLADHISYDHSSSGLTANDVQGAIDEVDGYIVNQKNGTTSVEITESMLCLCQNTSRGVDAFFMFPFFVKNPNYSISVTHNGSISGVGTPTTVTIDSKENCGFQFHSYISGLTANKVYMLGAMKITITFA